MYIRIKTTPNSPKKSVQIVKSVRKGKKVSQKIVRHIGCAFDDVELKKMKELAEYIKIKIETEVQPALYNPEDLVKMAIETRLRNEENKNASDDKPINVNLSQLREEQRLICGVHEVYGRIYKELGFDYSLGHPQRKVSANKNLFNMVMARIANPASKRASVLNLERDFGVSLSLNGVYKMMDEITDTQIDFIQRKSYDAAMGILQKEVNVVFYDCTTLYFESFTEDELKQNGYSKDMKFNQAQVMLALMATKEGFPISYELFPGAEYEGNTLKTALDNLNKKYKISKVVFVADSGMFSKKNIEMLEESGYKYIVGARMKNMDKEMKKSILDMSKYIDGEDGAKRSVIDYGSNRRLIVRYSPKKAKKDRCDREKAIEKLKKKLEKSKNPASLISNYGYKKYLLVQSDAKIEINEDKLKLDSLWDGLHGVITNDEEMAAADIITHYHDLWQIEESFRISKHDLRIRPIFHWTPQKIKAHIAICFMSLVCLRHLSYRVAIQYENLSPEQIRNELVHVQVSILKHQQTGKRYCIPSRTTKHMRKIYQAMGMKIDNTPYEL